jgi:hypothetical protein
MTNTLHRFGGPETLQDDYIVFAMAARGINEEGAPPKLQTFLRLALKHRPINVGNAIKGGIFALQDLTPLAHWRPRPPGPGGEHRRLHHGGRRVRRRALEAFLRPTADLGISINVSALMMAHLLQWPPGTASSTPWDSTGT